MNKVFLCYIQGSVEEHISIISHEESVIKKFIEQNTACEYEGEGIYYTKGNAYYNYGERCTVKSFGITPVTKTLYFTYVMDECGNEIFICSCDVINTDLLKSSLANNLSCSEEECDIICNYYNGNDIRKYVNVNAEISYFTIITERYTLHNGDIIENEFKGNTIDLL